MTYVLASFHVILIIVLEDDMFGMLNTMQFDVTNMLMCTQKLTCCAKTVSCVFCC